VPKNDKTHGKKVKGKGDDKKPDEAASQDELIAPLSWAQRLKRVFNIDIALCPLCGGTMRVIADITDPDIIQKILDHIEAPLPPLYLATAPSVCKQSARHHFSHFQFYCRLPYAGHW